MSTRRELAQEARRIQREEREEHQDPDWMTEEERYWRKTRG